ncbi:unnamed protein product [Durusdinium trenchii]|uniref:Gamma-glutamylcyclotransferase AIG2-like domain-containing protein n=1 Tax=Durusdinium trenchii TaxID=1381693 RepID=A0ABP0H9U0_9DINO
MSPSASHVDTTSAMAEDVRAVFAYGTLRGDFSEKGDFWGVIAKTGAAWVPASVPGFKLYQEDCATYPFALQTESSEDVLHGTLLMWSQTLARRAIQRCDQIEGFDPESPHDGLYRRAMVDVPVSVDGLMKMVKEKDLLKDILGKSSDPSKDGDSASVTVRAFVYHQPMDGREKEVKHFPGGDWLSK